MGNVNVYVKSEILNSWKEIAKYLDRGVRTAQRWERDLQLPVRRPRGKRRSAVLALRKEIDAWLGSCPQLVLDAENEDLRRRAVQFPGHSTTSLSSLWKAAGDVSVAR
jgi:hypothetical protein